MSHDLISNFVESASIGVPEFSFRCMNVTTKWLMDMIPPHIFAMYKYDEEIQHQLYFDNINQSSYWVLMKAKSLFDTNRYLECEKLIASNPDLHKNQCAIFIWCYSMYVSGEQKYQLQMMKRPTLDSGRPVNSTYGKYQNTRIDDVIATLNRFAEQGLDSASLWLLGSCLARRGLMEDAKVSLVQAVVTFECNWSAWIELVRILVIESIQAAQPMVSNANMADYIVSSIDGTNNFNSSDKNSSIIPKSSQDFRERFVKGNVSDSIPARVAFVHYCIQRGIRGPSVSKEISELMDMLPGVSIIPALLGELLYVTGDSLAAYNVLLTVGEGGNGSGTTFTHAPSFSFSHPLKLESVVHKIDCLYDLVNHKIASYNNHLNSDRHFAIEVGGEWRSKLIAEAAQVGIDYPATMEALYCEGLVHLISNHVGRAIECFDAATMMRPRDLRSVYRKGTAFLALKNYPAACEMFRRVIEEDETNVEARRALSETYLIMHQPLLAVSHAWKTVCAAEQTGREAKMWEHMARVWMSMGDDVSSKRAAVACLERAVLAEPPSAERLRQLWVETNLLVKKESQDDKALLAQLGKKSCIWALHFFCTALVDAKKLAGAVNSQMIEELEMLSAKGHLDDDFVGDIGMKFLEKHWGKSAFGSDGACISAMMQTAALQLSLYCFEHQKWEAALMWVEVVSEGPEQALRAQALPVEAMIRQNKMQIVN